MGRRMTLINVKDVFDLRMLNTTIGRRSIWGFSKTQSNQAVCLAVEKDSPAFVGQFSFACASKTHGKTWTVVDSIEFSHEIVSCPSCSNERPILTDIIILGCSCPRVECTACGLRGPHRRYTKDAIEAWSCLVMVAKDNDDDSEGGWQ